jgi:hypothetical protein
VADITYHYNDAGEAVEMELDGKRHEITAADRSLVPVELGSEFEIRDLQVTVRSTLEQMADSYSGGAILVDIEATHFGYVNSNHYNYVADGGKKSVGSWTKPYGKPYLINHDMMETPRGRVVGAKYVSTGKATGYHALDTRIAHADEVAMVLDSRALTVSVGSNPIDTVECSICNHDMYTNGAQMRGTYTLDSAPSDHWLDSPAPGMYGMFGLDNRRFWDFKTQEDGTHTAKCRHLRGTDAPRGGEQFDKVGWNLHQQNYREVSRVNLPADYNAATGEFAHIRGVLKQTDGLDLDTQFKMVVDKLSQVSSGPVDRARYTVVSERDLFRPTSIAEAVDYAEATNCQTMFDHGQWLAIQAAMDTSTADAQIEAYVQAGGRFIQTDITNRLSAADALQLDDARVFGRWLRAQDALDRDEKQALDALFTRNLLKRLNS